MTNLIFIKSIIFSATILFCILPIYFSQLESLDGITLITPSTIDDILHKNKNIFILFHRIKTTEDMEPFSKMLKEFKKAHKVIKETQLPLIFAIVDATNYPKVAERLEVSEFPVYRLLREGNPIPYTWSVDHKDLLYFLDLCFNPVSNELYLPDDVEKFINKKEAVIFFGEPSDENPRFNEFLNIAQKYTDVLFGHCGTVQCLEYYKVQENEIIFFKKQVNSSYDLKMPWEASRLIGLIEAHKTKVFEKFDEWVADFIFTRNNIGLFLFRDKENSQSKKFELMVKRVAKYFKGVIYFSIVDIKAKHEIELAKITKVKAKDLPCVYIHDARQENILTYKLQDEITESNIYKFALDFGLSKLEPFYASEEPIPMENQTYPIITLVGKSFKELILDNSQDDIFVYIYSNECKHCHKAGMLFEKFATAALLHNKNLKFMKMNSDGNDLPRIEVMGLPNFKLFKVGRRYQPEDYPLTEDRSIKRLGEFLVRSLPYFTNKGIDDQLDEDFEREYENLITRLENSSENQENKEIKDEM